MIDESAEEDAALYALGVLSPDDSARFEEALRGDAELRALVDELHEVGANLAHLAPQHTPPAHLRIQLLSAIRGENAPEIARTSRSSWIPWALAAGFALVAGVLGLERGRMRQEIVALRSQDALSQLRIATLASKVEGSPETVGSVAWDSGQQRGVLTLEKLPPAGPAQDYQLWVIDPQYKQPVSGGIVRVDESGSARLIFTVDVPIRSADKFAVSRERKGGAPTAEGPIVLLGQ